MTTAFLCPRCGNAGDFAGRCDDCDVDRIDAARFPAWGTRGVQRDDSAPTVDDRWARGLGAVAGAGFGLATAHAFADGIFSQTWVHIATLFLVLAFALRGRRTVDGEGRGLDEARLDNEPRDGRAGGWLTALLLLPLAALALLPFAIAHYTTTVHPVDLDGVVLGALAGGALLRPLRRQVLSEPIADVDAEAFARVAVTPIAASEPAVRVKIRGRVRVVRPTFGPGGVPCAAYEICRTTHGSRSIRACGGVFDVVDAEGGVARVVGEWLRVLDPRGRGEFHAIADGDEVEVVGTGRWLADAALDAGGPRDAAGRVLELTGREAQPIVARVVPAPRPVTDLTAVRVARLEAREGYVADEAVDDAAEATPADAAPAQRTPTSSTSNTSVELGGIAPGKPSLP